MEQSASLDARNAALMGEVLEFVKSHNDVPEVEAFFDSKVPELDGNFMAHLNRQEKRLLASPSATVETAKLLDMVKVVKVLSTEAVGRSLSEGEAAISCSRNLWLLQCLKPNIYRRSFPQAQTSL